MSLPVETLRPAPRKDVFLPQDELGRTRIITIKGGDKDKALHLPFISCWIDRENQVAYIKMEKDLIIQQPLKGIQHFEFQVLDGQFDRNSILLYSLNWNYPHSS